jgi:hypothetical protein
MIISKLKSAILERLETLDMALRTGACDDFADYRYVVGQHFAYRETLQFIKDVVKADEAPGSDDFSTED